jgi:hypothetical protein
MGDKTNKKCRTLNAALFCVVGEATPQAISNLCRNNEVIFEPACFTVQRCPQAQRVLNTCLSQNVLRFLLQRHKIFLVSDENNYFSCRPARKHQQGSLSGDHSLFDAHVEEWVVRTSPYYGFMGSPTLYMSKLVYSSSVHR